MTKLITVGELVARFLEVCGIDTAFGVISIHNMPILDAFGRRGKTRFVPARSAQGAANMADAFARVRGGLGVVVSSTGTAAGNSCGALIEALAAGTPVLHITGQIERPHLDKGWGSIHESRDELTMLGAVSKRALRVWSAESALGVLREAVHAALTPPAGPVSVEIPIDVQQAIVPTPADLSPIPLLFPRPSPHALDELANRLTAARRPLLWLGGGARGASAAAARLIELGFGVVTSVNGRGTVPEDHPLSLGAFNLYDAAEHFYQSCDALLVVGSQLRSKETRNYRLKLPHPLYRIDADSTRDGRSYGSELFIAADASLALDGLADRLRGRADHDSSFPADLARARAGAEAFVRSGLGPYAPLVEALRSAVSARRCLWVRDVTVSNSIWGNRLIALGGPREGVHAVGDGIGQGVPMAIGAALAGTGKKVFCMCGDGGLMVNVGELATLAEERADVVVLLMNDRGYTMIKNAQDAHYEGRRRYVDLRMPDFERLCASLDLAYRRIDAAGELAEAVRAGAQTSGPIIIEIDMDRIGSYPGVAGGPAGVGPDGTGDAKILTPPAQIP